MDTELLETFLELRKTRHFGRAAEKLFVTQAAVSARIKLLERQLDCQLFLRERGALRTTPEGERLVAPAEAAIQAVQRARAEVAATAGGQQVLTVAATQGLWHYPFATLLDVAEVPDLALRALAVNSADLAKMLEDRVIDIALAYDPMQLQDCASQRLGKLELSLMHSGESEQEQDYIHIDWGAGFDAFFARRFPGRGWQRYTNNAALAERSLAVSQGSAYLPRQFADSRLQINNSAPKFSREVFATWHSGNPKAEACQQLVSRAAQQLA